MVAVARNRDRVMVSVSQDVWDDAHTEATALRRDAREAANMIPLARFVHQRVAIDCDPQTEQAQAIVVHYLERAARRSGE